MDMTRDELKDVIRPLKAAYTSERFIPDRESFEVWYISLKGFTKEQVAKASANYILSHRFPPTIADIYGECTDRNTDAEAWAEVLRAIKNSTYHAEEEYKRLSPATRRAIGSPEYLKELAQTEHLNITVVNSNFRKAYENAKLKVIPDDESVLLEDKKQELIPHEEPPDDGIDYRELAIEKMKLYRARKDGR